MQRFLRLALVVDVVVHLVTLALGMSEERWGVVRVTQELLMPLLLLDFLATPRRPRRSAWVVLALVFCFLGDTLPAWVDASQAFLAMVGAFAIAQACFSIALWPARRRVRARVVVGYAAAYLALLVICLPGLDAMLVPVIGYGLLLATTGVLASGRSLVAGLGGALFFFSDALIAVRTFSDLAPGRPGAWLVMVTYILGVWLLAKSFTVTTGVDAR